MIKLHTILREEDGDGEGGSNASALFGIPTGASGLENDPPASTEEPSGEPDSTPAPKEPTKPAEPTTPGDPTKKSEEGEPAPIEPQGVDPTLALNIVDKALNQGRQGQALQQPAMTPEAIDEALGVFNVSPELVEAMWGENATPEGRMAALQEIVNRTAQNAIKTSGHTMRFANDDIRNEFNPALQNAKSNTEKEFTGLIEQAYPGFKDKGVLIQNVMTQMRGEGYQTSGPEAQAAEEAAFEVVRRATLLAQTMDSSFDPSKDNSKPVAKQPEMVAMAGAGAGGGSESSTGSPNDNIPAWKQALA